jgi:hypothetical protein
LAGGKQGGWGGQEAMAMAAGLLAAYRNDELAATNGTCPRSTPPPPPPRPRPRCVCVCARECVCVQTWGARLGATGRETGGWGGRRGREGGRFFAVFGGLCEVPPRALFQKPGACRVRKGGGYAGLLRWAWQHTQAHVLTTSPQCHFVSTGTCGEALGLAARGWRLACRTHETGLVRWTGILSIQV